SAADTRLVCRLTACILHFYTLSKPMMPSRVNTRPLEQRIVALVAIGVLNVAWLSAVSCGVLWAFTSCPVRANPVQTEACHHGKNAPAPQHGGDHHASCPVQGYWTPSSVTDGRVELAASLQAGLASWNTFTILLPTPASVAFSYSRF